MIRVEVAVGAAVVLARARRHVHDQLVAAVRRVFGSFTFFPVSMANIVRVLLAELIMSHNFRKFRLEEA